MHKPSVGIALWILLLLGLLGAYLGLSGILMSGSFAVAGPAASADATLAYWKRVQLWYDGLAVGSLAVVLVCATALVRKRRARRTAD